MNGYLKQVQPKVKRRFRTSVAMISLAISMGGPNLLLTRQSNRAPAAEPVDNEQTTASTVPTVTATDLGEGTTQVKVEASQPLPVNTSASTEQVPVVPQTSVDKAVKITPPSGIASTPKQLSIESDNLVGTYNTNRSNYKIETSATIDTLPSFNTANSSPSISSVATLSPQNLPTDEPQTARNVSGVSTSPQQRLLINRLKQPNRFNNRAELRSEESKQETVPITESSQHLANFEELPNSSQTSINSSVGAASIGITPAPKVVIPESKPTFGNVLPESNQKNITVVAPPSEKSTPVVEPFNSSPAPAGVVVPEVTIAPSSNQIDIASTLDKNSSQATAAPEVVAPSIEPFDFSQSSVPELATEVPPTLNSIPASTSSSVEAKSVEQNTTEALPPEIESPALESDDLITEVPSIEPNSTTGDNSSLLTTPAPSSNSVAQKSQPSSVETVVEPEIPDFAVNEPIAVEAALQKYQVKPGDTLSLIARNYGVSLTELVIANKLTNPDRLQINQQLTIPTFIDNSTTEPTTAAIELPKYSEVNTQPQPLQARALLATHTGVGGDISEGTTDLAAPPVAPSQLDQVAIEPKQQSHQSVQNLQNDIQKLRQKYFVQQTRFVPVVSQTTVNQVPTSTHLSAAQPTNPEFRVAQAATSQSAQKQLVSQQRPIVRQTRSKARVATIPSSVAPAASLESMRGRQVSPELPPLGAVDIYLPKPSSVPLKGYIWPTKGVLTSGYGWRWGRMHKGIDVAAPIGTPVVAAAQGVVVRSGWNSGGYGKLVDIQHNDGSITRYAHNNRLLVQAGQQVEQGQRISEMGSTGFSTGPHLHFEVHPTGRGAVNPIALLPGR